MELPVYTAEMPVLEKLTGYALTRGMLCAMRRPAPKDAAALLRRTSCVAVLEDVVNPTNLGAIFRSAAALGVEAVLLTPNCTDPLYRRAIRVSMGNVFLVPWAYLPDDHWQALLKEGGCLFIGDVAFRTREALEACQKTAGDTWDTDEIYFVYDELRSHFPALTFESFSHCTALLTLRR